MGDDETHTIDTEPPVDGRELTELDEPGSDANLDEEAQKRLAGQVHEQDEHGSA